MKSAFAKYLEAATTPLDSTFPKRLQVDQYNVDGCGDVIDEFDQWYGGTFNTCEKIISNGDELTTFFEGLNHLSHYRIIEL